MSRTNVIVTEFEGSASISKLAFGHGPEPVTSTSHSHNLSPLVLNVILPSITLIYEDFRKLVFVT